MKDLKLVMAAAFFAASASLCAAGTIKTYTSEAAFAANDAVDWTADGTAREEKPLEAARTLSGKSITGAVTVSVGAANGTLRRVELGSGSSNGRRVLSTSGGSGPLTISFTSGPVMGVAAQVQSTTPGPFTAQMNVFDAGGNLLGTGTANFGRSAERTASFMGVRSSLKDIARVEIATSSPGGLGIEALKLALSPAIENDTFFVDQLFHDLYGRAPSTAEQAKYLGALKEGDSTRERTAAELFSASEFHDNAAYVVECYLTLLQRDPDFDGWSQISKLMHDGTKPDSVLAGFMSTPDYAAAYPASLSDAAFVTKVHQNFLGRDPEPNELDSWGSKLAQGGTRAALIQFLLASPEFEARFAGRVNANLGYLAFLRRGGEPQAITQLTEMLETGSPMTAIIDSLMSMQEYTDRF